LNPRTISSKPTRRKRPFQASAGKPNRPLLPQERLRPIPTTKRSWRPIS
jgi:hypothetical protein